MTSVFLIHGERKKERKEERKIGLHFSDSTPDPDDYGRSSKNRRVQFFQGCFVGLYTHFFFFPSFHEHIAKGQKELTPEIHLRINRFAFSW